MFLLGQPRPPSNNWNQQQHQQNYSNDWNNQYNQYPVNEFYPPNQPMQNSYANQQCNSNNSTQQYVDNNNYLNSDYNRNNQWSSNYNNENYPPQPLPAPTNTSMVNYNNQSTVPNKPSLHSYSTTSNYVNGNFGEVNGNCYPPTPITISTANKCQNAVTYQQANTGQNYAPPVATQQLTGPCIQSNPMMPNNSQANSVVAANQSTSQIASNENQQSSPPPPPLSAMSCRSVSSMSMNMVINDMNSTMNTFVEENRFLQISLN